MGAFPIQMLFICLFLASRCFCLHSKRMQVTVSAVTLGKNISVSGNPEKNLFPFMGKGQVFLGGRVFSTGRRIQITVQGLIFIFLKK